MRPNQWWAAGHAKATTTGYDVWYYSTLTGDRKEFVGNVRDRRAAERLCIRLNKGV